MRLPRRLLEALIECKGYKGRPYWWRQSSMRKLESYGYVQQTGGTDKNPSWEISEAGLEHLKGLPGT